MKTLTLLFCLLSFCAFSQEGQPSSEVYILQGQSWYTVPEGKKIQCNADRPDCYPWWNVDTAMCCIPCVNPAHEYSPEWQAILKRTTNGQYMFNLVGDNGEIVATSETYKRKAKAIQTLKKYFPTFKIIDQ